MPDHIVFLDGVTGYLGRWTLFWLLEELPDERVAVLIRPSSRGAGSDPDVRLRLDQVLASIGMSSERHRVTPLAGDLGSPQFRNPEAVDSLRAPIWMHLAGDVRFKKLGTRSSSVNNRDHTASFLDAARRARCRPGTVCHTSTFYAFEKAGPPEATFTVPEDFLDPAEMQHHNAYGLSKLEAETLLRDEVRRRSLPFTVLIFRPDIIAHHAPAPAVARRNPGLLVDDFRVMYGLLASLAGLDGQPWGYLPVDGATRLYTSDADSVTRAMAHLALLYGDGSLDAPGGYRIFNLANRWHPLTCAELKSICAEIAPQATAAVRHVSPAEFREAVWPRLSPAERLYYSTFVEPFAGYLSRPRTDPSTEHADSVLGEDWHLLHPRHGRDVRTWFKQGAQQVLAQRLGAAA